MSTHCHVTPATSGLQVKQTALHSGTIRGHGAKKEGILHHTARGAPASVPGHHPRRPPPSQAPKHRSRFQEVSPSPSSPLLLGLLGGRREQPAWHDPSRARLPLEADEAAETEAPQTRTSGRGGEGQGRCQHRAWEAPAAEGNLGRLASPAGSSPCGHR